MTKLTKSINKLTHDGHRNDSYDDRYYASYDDRYDERHDRHDGHKPRYCDGHREESDRDYEDYGIYRKRYRSPCRHDPRKSERYPNCPENEIEEQMDEIVQSSVNILKKCQQTLKQIKEELCTEGLPVNSYCPIQTPIDQNIFAVNADNFSCGGIFSNSDISDNESKHIISNEEIQNLLTDYYRGEAQFRETVRWAQKTLFRVKLAHLMG